VELIKPPTVPPGRKTNTHDTWSLPGGLASDLCAGGWRTGITLLASVVMGRPDKIPATIRDTHNENKLATETAGPIQPLADIAVGGYLLVISTVIAMVIALAMWTTISTVRAVGVMPGSRHWRFQN
jgi:hypothetical protein